MHIQAHRYTRTRTLARPMKFRLRMAHAILKDPGSFNSGNAPIVGSCHAVHERRLQDFVSAVMDVDYSPTGREFVAGSYDRSVRIFPHTGMRAPALVCMFA